MIRKILKTIFCVLNIGALKLAVLGCLTSSDCLTPTTSTGLRKYCCHLVHQPPRCMDVLDCYLARTVKTTRAPFLDHTAPDFNKFTLPDYNKFTLPDYNKFTLPDYNKFTVPDYNVPDIHIDPSDNNYDNYDNDYNSSDSTSSSPGAIIGSMFAVILLSIFIFCFRYLRLQRRRNGVCFVRPPMETTNATSRTNLVSQESERPSLVIIAIRRNEGESVSQNLPPEGEPPFLSEDEILQNLKTTSGPEPPPYEEAFTTPSLNDPPKYEDLPPLPQDTAQMPNPSLNTIPVQPNVDLPAVNPPSYEESQATSNDVAR